MKKSAHLKFNEANYALNGYPKDAKGVCSVCGHDVYVSVWSPEEEARITSGSFTKAYCNYCRDEAIIVEKRSGARLGDSAE